MPTARPDIRKEAIESGQTSLQTMFIASRKAELNHAGYIILQGMADPRIATLTIYRAARVRDDYLEVKVREFYSFFS